MLLHYFGVDGSESTMTRLLSKMTSKTLEMMAEYIWSRSDFRGWNKIGNCPEKIEPRAQHHRIKCSRYFLFYNVQENGRTVLPDYSFLKAEVILFESVVLNYTHFFSSFFFFFYVCAWCFLSDLFLEARTLWRTADLSLSP